MKKKLSRFYCRVICLLLLLLLLQTEDGRIYARSYKMITYQWEQGFKAATGYCLFQDSKGYLWISTENGLIRFNGYDFKMFTTRDGLPDNEVFDFEEDEQKRLWVLPFANSIAYIQNGKVFNPGNDSLLKRLTFRSRPLKILFDKKGNTWINEARMLTRITSNGTQQKIKTNAVCLIWLDAQGKLMVFDGNKWLHWQDQKFTQFDTLSFIPSIYTYVDTSVIFDPENGKLIHYSCQPGQSGIDYIITAPKITYVRSGVRMSENELLITTDHGAYIYDFKANSLTDSFLLEHKMGAVLKTKDGAIWLGTAGSGIFRFLSTPIQSLKSKLLNASIVYLKGTADGMYCITDKSVFIETKFKGGRPTTTTSTSIVEKGSENSHHYYIGQNKNGKWISCAHRIFLKDKIDGRPEKSLFGHSKAALEEGTGNLLVATIFGAYRLDRENFRVLDTFLVQQRVTALAKLKDVIYAGTLNGLIACYPDKHYAWVMKDTTLLKSHITALCTGKNEILWAANGDAEIVAIRKDSLVAVCNFKNGLQCNRISSLKASDKFIWIGTDNGLFAVEQKPPYNIVRHITYATGLNSNQINCIDVYGKRIWVGTINGVNYFDEDDIFKVRDNAAIIVNCIRNGDSILSPTKGVLQMTDNSLSIDFDIVDFSGGFKPVFQYKIGDKEWVNLNGNNLTFPALPYGDFTLTLRALSPNWKECALFTQTFYNPPPFYRTWWFAFTASLACIIILLATAFFIVKRFRKRDKDKLQVQQNLLMLEQMALQGQMNPHFIFNCISALRHYYASGNIEKADRFVDYFSLLIRQTFELGTTIFVPLDKELGYLTQYLSVERMRFNDSFSFHIRNKLSDTENDIVVPTMLLQPIIENAVRHGIRHLPDHAGVITISVVVKDDLVVFEVMDNGIGYKRSMQLKNQSLPDALTSSMVNEKRIRILNKIFYGQINMITEDFYTDGRHDCGTRVIISFPNNLKELQQNEGNNN